jgi:hypothetical protein
MGGRKVEQLMLDLSGDRKIRALGGSGILCDEDIKEFSAATLRVKALMVDGKWHTADEIKLAAGSDGFPASEGLRRMRELRREFNIERRRASDKRNFEYRIAGVFDEY